jgi:fibronectin type 3 domain-containing protein
MGQMKKLAVLLLVVMLVVPAVRLKAAGEVKLPDVCWLSGIHDRKTNSVTLTWINPPDGNNIEEYRIYFNGSPEPVGIVKPTSNSFTHQLQRSWIGLTLTYTVKSFGKSESQGSSTEIIPTMAWFEAEGINDETVMTSGQTYKIPIKPNKYVKGKSFLEIIADSGNSQTKFETVIEEGQKEFYYTVPTMTGKAAFLFWVNQDRKSLAGKYECKISTLNPLSSVKLTEPDNGARFVKGQAIRIGWKHENLPNGGSFRVELWTADGKKMIEQLPVDPNSSGIEWKIPVLYRHDRVFVVVYFKHLMNYLAKPALVFLDKPMPKMPSRPSLSLNPDQKRNQIDININCINDGSANIDYILAIVSGSDSSKRSYKIIPEISEKTPLISERFPIYHVQIGVTYTVTVTCVTADGESPKSEEASYSVPLHWAQVYITSLQPGDSIQVGSRFELKWKYKNFGPYLGADQLLIVTPQKTYDMTYFKTNAHATGLYVLLEGLVELDDVKVWLKVITEPDSNGRVDSYFDCVDNLKLVSPPSFPVNSDVVGTKVTLSWNKVANATYYNIRKKGYFEKFSRQKSIKDPTVYEDREIVPDSVYDYQIEARGQWDEIIARSDVTIQSKPSTIKPTTTTGKSYVSISWDRISWVEGYYVYRYDVSDWKPMNADTLSTNEFIDTDLVPGQEYCYRIEAVTDYGRTVGFSEKFCARTEHVPIEMKTEPDTQSVYLRWDNVLEATSYDIWRKDIGEFTNIATGLKERRFTDTNLLSDSVYTYRIEGIDSFGNVVAKSENSETRTLKIESLTVEATANHDQRLIKLKWPKISKASRLELWRDGVMLKVLPSSSSEYAEMNLAVPAKYCYQIKAWNINGNLIASGETCVELQKTRTKVVFAVGSTSWTVDGVQQEKMSAAPEISGGRLFLVVRYLTKTVGAGVSWDAKTKTVEVMRKDGYWFKMQVGIPKANVNGQEVFIDPGNKTVAPYIKNGLTLCPFRFIANNLGATNDRIFWDPETKTVTIEF